jgi:hypothetical protein
VHRNYGRRLGDARLCGAGGLYWLVPAALVAIVAGLASTWVLLIEILR